MENKFEENLKRLQEINDKLENEKLSLDESIKLYEEGIEISKSIEKSLKEAEAKVEKIIESK